MYHWQAVECDERHASAKAIIYSNRAPVMQACMGLYVRNNTFTNVALINTPQSHTGWANENFDGKSTYPNEETYEANILESKYRSIHISHNHR